jgi:undecaprenyl-diphosphatase
MRPVWGWALSLLGGAALTLLVKRRIRRPRPIESWLLHGQGADRYSFPSGHAVRWGIIAAWSSRFVPYGTLVAWTLALWTGWSRVHLGIHYVGDVLAGYAAGALVGWLVRRALGERGKA